jgi:glycosyltransferase involved in cell wall biosynthesis
MVDEIIVADGGSTDGTLERISNFVNKCNLKIIKGKFVGYGDAIRNAIEHASGDIIILVEGDATFRSRDIYKMYEYIKDCDMVIGTRTTNELINQGANMSTGLRIANLMVAKFIELLWIKREPRLTDVGCTYRTFWKNEYDEIKHNFIGVGPEFSPEMMIEFIKNNKRVIEIPVSYYARIGGASKYSKNSLAIIRTGLRMISLILKKRISN